MDRYWIVYKVENEYQLLSRNNFFQADRLQCQIAQLYGGTPLGIYDAVARIFEWEPVRRYFNNKLDRDEQTQQDQRIIEQIHLLWADSQLNAEVNLSVNSR